MSASRVLPQDRARLWERHRLCPRAWWIAAGGLAIVLGVALVELCWRVGASSLFLDEVASWRAADVSLGELFHRVRVYELAPPAYYLLLHGWIRLWGSDSEVAMRSLSVLAAMGLVAAVWWVAGMVAGRPAAFLAALLTAVSPLVLEYGQEVRAYAWAMLATTLAVGCALRALEDRRGQARWLALAALTAVASMWLHYTAALVIAPLTAFVLVSSQLTLGRRLRFAAAMIVGGGLLLPLLGAQLRQGNQNAVAAVAQLSVSNLERVVGAPFDRTYNLLPSAETLLGAVLVAAAVGLLVLPGADKRVSHPRMLAVLAASAPLGLILLTAAGRPELISRYDAVATPFMAISLAASIAMSARIGIPIVLAALYIALPASIASHQPQHAYPNTRAAVQEVARYWQRGDVLILGAGYPANPYSLQYYATHLLPKGAVVGYTHGTRLLLASIRRKRVPGIALITQPVESIKTVTQNFARIHFRVVTAKDIQGAVPMQAFVANRAH